METKTVYQDRTKGFYQNAFAAYKMEEQNMPEEKRVIYRDNTYEIVSKVAYLIGVPRRIFENVNEAPKLEIYEKLDKEPAARIIRNLCMVRTSIERNFKKIHDKMTNEYWTIVSLPEYIPMECLNQLNADGIQFVKKSSVKLCHHVIEINRIIMDRINNCKKFFPVWVNWNYIRDIFIMPEGLRESGTKAAAEIYYSKMAWYPYQVYMNWKPQDAGNILHNDKKFVTLLYRWHGDSFREESKVSDASEYIKGNIYEFIETSEKVIFVVDCENADPYKLCAALKNLDYEYTQKVASILLFDDIHTASAWRILDAFTRIPVEHIMIDRVKQNKSLVDIKLTARACQEHYKNQVDSFVIVSSDSDYWGLISSLPDARFMVMIESEHCGPDLKRALENANIFYCYIDDFYSANAEDIKYHALVRAMSRYIQEHMDVNINAMFEEALRTTRVEMSEAEKKQFVTRHVRTIRMSIDENGQVLLEFKKKIN